MAHRIRDEVIIPGLSFNIRFGHWMANGVIIDDAVCECGQPATHVANFRIYASGVPTVGWLLVCYPCAVEMLADGGVTVDALEHIFERQLIARQLIARQERIE
jgi:hypothetical protein